MVLVEPKKNTQTNMDSTTPEGITVAFAELYQGGGGYVPDTISEENKKCINCVRRAKLAKFVKRTKYHACTIASISTVILILSGIICLYYNEYHQNKVYDDRCSDMKDSFHRTNQTVIQVTSVKFVVRYMFQGHTVRCFLDKKYFPKSTSRGRSDGIHKRNRQSVFHQECFYTMRQVLRDWHGR